MVVDVAKEMRHDYPPVRSPPVEAEIYCRGGDP